MVREFFRRWLVQKVLAAVGDLQAARLAGDWTRIEPSKTG